MLNKMDILTYWGLFSSFCGLACLVSLALYILPLIYLSFASPQNLREKYGAWAVVTGASSGIGKAITKRLASQGVNVFLVALDDDLLKTTHAELQKQFPSVQLRAVPVNLGSDPEAYMKEIAEATQGVQISIFISNAGFLLMGFFEQRPFEQHVTNIECNALAAIRLTHYFYKRMIDEGVKGCIAFTSSAAWFMPSPFASMYGATKAMVTHFATSLALEADTHGIDVTVLHPSYTHSNLYAKSPKLGVVAVLSKFGWTPDDVADVLFRSVGRTVVRDLGMYAISTNILARYIDSAALTMSIMPFVESMAPPGSIKRNNTANAGSKKEN